MSEPFLAEIRIVAFNFAPRGWAFCDGQILPINQNQSLYSLLGTVYGGDGRTSFALPDLRGRIPYHVGGQLRQGQKSGEEMQTLSVNEMPSHNHQLQCHPDPVSGNSVRPDNNLLAESPLGDIQYSSGDPDGYMRASSLANAGGGQAHGNLPPYLVVNFVIALQGLFPSRN
jgi:microcystin-dependent protein